MSTDGATQEMLCSVKLREHNSEVTSWDFNVNVSNMMRDNLKEQEEIARSYLQSVQATWKAEAIDQARIAMRHIEDARMRYWKVIQYLWDGVSKYDK